MRLAKGTNSMKTGMTLGTENHFKEVSSKWKPLKELAWQSGEGRVFQAERTLVKAH